MRCACGKVPYPTELGALRAAARIAGAHGRLYTHPCFTTPGAWHLTRNPPRASGYRAGLVGRA